MIEPVYKQIVPVWENKDVMDILKKHYRGGMTQYHTFAEEPIEPASELYPCTFLTCLRVVHRENAPPLVLMLENSTVVQDRTGKWFIDVSRFVTL